MFIYNIYVKYTIYMFFYICKCKLYRYYYYCRFDYLTLRFLPGKRTSAPNINFGTGHTTVSWYRS